MEIKGDFTIWKAIKDVAPKDLERYVGFEEGRLKAGFKIICMVPGERLRPRDFGLGGSTRFSGARLEDGTHIEKAFKEREGWNANAIKKKLAAFFHKSQDNRPVKVIPDASHIKGVSKYPAATVLDPAKHEDHKTSGIPQFHLLRPKPAYVIRVCGPDYVWTMLEEPQGTSAALPSEPELLSPGSDEPVENRRSRSSNAEHMPSFLRNAASVRQFGAEHRVLGSFRDRPKPGAE
jgi:hypothetical protein